MHATICDMITDLVQNAFEAQATEVRVSFKQTPKEWHLLIKDNGKGMSADLLEKAKDPFFTDGQKHVHRSVGLGLPFLFQTAEATQATARVESKKGQGTQVEFVVDPQQMDLPALGDLSTTWVHLLSHDFGGNLILQREKNKKTYEVSSQELREILGDLNDLSGLSLLKEFMTNQELSLEIL